MAKLSTPQNVSVTDNQLSFSEVANAQWYSILANGNEIGTYGNVAPETTNAYRVVVSKPAGVTLNVTVNDKPDDPDAGIEYPVQSGWALYNGDRLTIYKMGSDQYLTINGVYYPANNTTQTITITDDDVLISLDGVGDAGGDNYAKVLVNFVQSTPYGTSKMWLGGKRLANLYNGTLHIRSAYLGTTKVFGLTDVYKVQSLLKNVIYCNEFGVPVDPPTEIATGGSDIYYIKRPDHYNLKTLTVTPNGVAKTLMISTTENITTINYSDPRGPFTIEAVAEKVSYPITQNLTNCQITSSNPATTIEYGGTVEYTIDPVNEYFELPKTVTVTGATGNWDAENGFLTISNPTGPVTFTATATRIVYTYNEKLTHCISLDGDLKTVQAGITFNRGYKADPGFAFPTTVTVTGAQSKWNAGSGELTVIDPTGNVNVTIAAVAKTFSYRFENTNCYVEEPTSGNILGGEMITRAITYDTNLYSLDSSGITVTGAKFTYENGSITIYEPTANVVVSVVATQIAYPYTSTAGHCTITPSTGYVSIGSTSKTKITIKPSTGYTMTTDSLIVQNATYNMSVSGDDLIVNVFEAKGAVTVTASAVKKNTITYDLKYCEVVPQPTYLLDGKSTTFTVKPLTGWKLPLSSNVTATGATLSYNASTGETTLSNPTGDIKFTAAAQPKTYSIKTVLTGCTIVSGPTTIQTMQEATFKLKASTGYKLPATKTEIGIQNAVKGSYTINAARSEATLVITGATGTVTLTITSERYAYPLTVTGTNCTVTTSSNLVNVGDELTTVYVNPNSGYTWDGEHTCTGATATEATGVGELKLSNATGDVTVTVTCVAASTNITYNLTHCTAASTNPTSVFIGASADFKFVADTGYVLGATPTVENGVLLDWSQPDITDPTTWVAAIGNAQHGLKITVVGSFALPKLDAPTGLSVTDSTLTFDAVENAEQYEVFAGSTSLGTYTPVTLINFTIKDEGSYQAESGMTWSQWVASSYNPGEYVIYDGGVTKSSGVAGSLWVATDSSISHTVSSSDVITATTYYYGQQQ